MTESVVIASAARAEDGACLAMADAADLTAATGIDYRITGGHMVTVHTARHDLARPLRQTGDADLGLQAQGARDLRAARRPR